MSERPRRGLGPRRPGPEARPQPPTGPGSPSQPGTACLHLSVQLEGDGESATHSCLACGREESAPGDRMTTLFEPSVEAIEACNWLRCRKSPNPCFAWCKCRCHARRVANLANDGQANDCTHLSATGVDTTPVSDPNKVWRCDHCGLRWTRGDDGLRAGIEALAQKVEFNGKSDRNDQRADPDIAQYWEGRADATFEILEDLRALLDQTRTEADR